jgi:hypothetical protein
MYSRRPISITILLVGLGFAFDAAIACDQDRIKRDAKWCLQDPNRDGYGDLMVGSCHKDADKTRSGFRSCQPHGDVRDNYDSCTAGQQIDAVRAAASELGLYQPGKCG